VEQPQIGDADDGEGNNNNDGQADGLFCAHATDGSLIWIAVIGA
jgi:hypothetical protein